MGAAAKAVKAAASPFGDSANKRSFGLPALAPPALIALPIKAETQRCMAPRKAKAESAVRWAFFCLARAREYSER